MADASLRYVNVHVSGEARWSRTEYILGRKSRSESRDSSSFRDQNGVRHVEEGPLRAWIQNHDLRRLFQLDFEARVYTASPIPYYRGRVGFKPRRRDRLRRSGRTVQVRTETIDTGERRVIFGNTARRVIIRTSHRYSPDFEGRSSDTEADCWYIDPPAAWLALHPPTPGHAILQQVVNGKMDTPEFTDIGAREAGFPLLAKSTNRHMLKDPEGNIRTFISEDKEEVVEFSEEPLNPDLFIPPHDFRRVARLPGDPVLRFGVRLRVGWQNLKHRFMTR